MTSELSPRTLCRLASPCGVAQCPERLLPGRGGLRPRRGWLRDRSPVAARAAARRCGLPRFVVAALLERRAGGVGVEDPPRRIVLVRHLRQQGLASSRSRWPPGSPAASASPRRRTATGGRCTAGRRAGVCRAARSRRAARLPAASGRLGQGEDCDHRSGADQRGVSSLPRRGARARHRRQRLGGSSQPARAATPFHSRIPGRPRRPRASVRRALRREYRQRPLRLASFAEDGRVDHLRVDHPRVYPRGRLNPQFDAARRRHCRLAIPSGLAVGARQQQQRVRVAVGPDQPPCFLEPPDLFDRGDCPRGVASQPCNGGFIRQARD